MTAYGELFKIYKELVSVADVLHKAANLIGQGITNDKLMALKTLGKAEGLLAAADIIHDRLLVLKDLEGKNDA